MNAITNFLIKKSRIFLRLLLEDPEVQKLLWKSANVRPVTPDMFYAAVPNSVTEELYRQATIDSAEYVNKHMMHLEGINTTLETLSFGIQQVTLEGLFLEFGVFSGYTINHIASQVDQSVHGFDSFEGLPEQWNGAKKGTFDCKGSLPNVSENVELHVGLFNETLSPFIEKHPEKIAFLHIDSDLYSSAKTIFNSLSDQIVSGTVIVFDEYYNYPGWLEHEFLAFKEFISETGHTYEYIAYTNNGFSVAVKIK